MVRDDLATLLLQHTYIHLIFSSTIYYKLYEMNITTILEGLLGFLKTPLI